MKKLAIRTGICLVLLACDDREISVMDDFGFELETQFESTAALLEAHRIDMAIQPLRYVEGTTYSLEYHVEGAEGHLVDSEGEPLAQREPLTLSGFEQLFYFMAESPGNPLVRAKVSDSFGSTQELDIPLSVATVGFDFSGLAADPSIYIGETVELNFNLSPEKDLPIAYTLQYRFVSNQGNLRDAHGNELNPNEAIPVNPGDLKFTFESNQIGNVDMEFILKNEFGEEIVIPIQLEVEQTDFDFTVAPVKSQADTDELVGLNFNFELLGVEELDYEIGFSSTHTGQFTTYSNSTTDWISNGDSKALDSFLVSQEEWSGLYRGMTSGDHEITITITASNGISHSKSFSVNFYSRPEVNIVKTGLRRYNKQGCFNGCDYDWDYLIFLDVAFNEGAIFKTVTLTVLDDRTNTYKEFNLGTYEELSEYQNFKIFAKFRDIESGGVYWFDEQPYQIIVRDSNDKVSDIYQGVFTYDIVDSD